MANIKQEAEMVKKFKRDHLYNCTILENYSVGIDLIPENIKGLYDLYGDAKYLGTKKIDLILIDEERTIIEVKERLNMESIGQVLSYQILYELQCPQHKGKTKPGILCKWLDPILMPVVKEFNIKIFQCT